MKTAEARHESKTKLLDAALHVIRAKGYSATRVEDICAAAGLTKGSFFHHFEGKEDLAIAAAGHWDVVTGAVFASAPYRALPDPVDRLLGYVDFRKAILRGELPDFTCLVGTMVQEVYDTHPSIREACDKSVSDHVAVVEADVAEAMRKYGIDAEWSARSLAFYTHAVIQGAFILAKTKQSAEVAAESLDHLRRYLQTLFRQAQSKGGSIVRTGTLIGQVEVENVNHPGQVRHLDADMYDAMKRAFLKILPRASPGLTVAEIQDRVVAHLPEALFPNGAKAGWWTKAVQLDLEAKGIIAREKTTPLRLHRA